MNVDDSPSCSAADQPLILCVDDEQAVRDSLSRILRRYGCEVVCASNGEEALQVLVRRQVNVLICDQQMPGMKGTEVLQQAKDISPATARIMLTGHCHCPEVVTKAVNEGEIMRLLAKPWEQDDIRRVVAEALGTTPELWSEQQRKIRRRMSKDHS